MSGLAAPRATGISPAPAASRTVRVFATTLSKFVFPSTHVIPMRFTKGERAAKRSANASSTPVSTSRIIFMYLPFN